MCELCTIAALGLVAGAAHCIRRHRKSKVNPLDVGGPKLLYAGNDPVQGKGHAKPDINRELSVLHAGDTHEL